MQIMQYVEHPNAKICWNCNPPDVTPAGTIKPNFDRMADRIALVHMRDIYIAEYPWRELVSLLQGINYQGFCLAEIPESPEPERIMGYYRALWDAYNDLARLSAR
jgi:sugar phosphate isomerase/epimerase